MADSKETLICPACGKEMEKIFIERANCNIDVCTNGCGGIFFDNREFKKFDGKTETIDEIKKALEGRTFNPVDKSYKRVCPACGMKMVKNSTSIKGEIIIDECYSCGGKFLDYNELDKIREEFPNEEARSQAVMNYLQQKMGSEFNEMHSTEIINEKIKHKRSFFDGIVKKFI